MFVEEVDACQEEAEPPLGSPRKNAMLLTTAETAVPPAAATQSNAVTRSWKSLDASKWLAMIGTSAVLRTVVYHPMNLATARQRVSRESLTVSQILQGVMKQERGRAAAVRCLYRGVGGAMLHNVIGDVSYLATVEYTRERFSSTIFPHEANTDANTPMSDSLAGMCGDMSWMAFGSPFYVLMYRQMTAGYGVASHNEYQPLRATLQSVWRESKWRGLYAGTVTSIALLPATALWWALYGHIKHQLYRGANALGVVRADAPSLSWRSATDNAVINTAAGVLAGVSTALISNPLNVVQGRMQVTNEFPEGQVGRSRILAVCRDLIAKEGWRGFMKGARAACAVSVFDGVLFAALYETTKIACDNSRS